MPSSKRNTRRRLLPKFPCVHLGPFRGDTAHHRDPIDIGLANQWCVDGLNASEAVLKVGVQDETIKLDAYRAESCDGGPRSMVLAMRVPISPALHGLSMAVVRPCCDGGDTLVPNCNVDREAASCINHK